MRMRNPSACAWMIVERRDLMVPTNSVVCSIGLGASLTISTAMGGMPPAGLSPPRLR